MQMLILLGVLLYGMWYCYQLGRDSYRRLEYQEFLNGSESADETP